MEKVLQPVLLVALVILGGAGYAQLDPDPDGIGIYHDPEATILVADVEPLAEIELYLLLTNASAEGGVAGWECRVELGDTGNLITGWHAVGYTGSIWSPPDFAVWLQPPLPWAPAIHLLTITVLVLDPACCWFYILPNSIPVFPGEVAYADGADPSHIITLHQSTGGPEIPVAGINCPSPVATVHTSWGSVRGLYRP